MWVEPCRAEERTVPVPGVHVHGGDGWSSHGWVRADAGIDYHAPGSGPFDSMVLLLRGRAASLRRQ
jgi:hypothetical protein